MKFLQKSLAFFLGTEYDKKDGQNAPGALKERDTGADQEIG